MLRETDGALRAPWGEAVGGDDQAAGADGEGVGAEPPVDLHVSADEAGRDRVAVPPQRHQRVRGDRADLDDLRRVRGIGQGEERLGIGELPDGGRRNGSIAGTNPSTPTPPRAPAGSEGLVSGAHPRIGRSRASATSMQNRSTPLAPSVTTAG